MPSLPQTGSPKWLRTCKQNKPGPHTLAAAYGPWSVPWTTWPSLARLAQYCIISRSDPAPNWMCQNKYFSTPNIVRLWMSNLEAMTASSSPWLLHKFSMLYLSHNTFASLLLSLPTCFTCFSCWLFINFSVNSFINFQQHWKISQKHMPKTRTHRIHTHSWWQTSRHFA